MTRATAEQLILNWAWIPLWLAYQGTPRTHSRLEAFFKWAFWATMAIAAFRLCNSYLAPLVFALPREYEMAVYWAWPAMGVLSAVTVHRLQRSAAGRFVAFLMGLVTFALFILVASRLYRDDATLASLLSGSVLTLVIAKQALDQLSPDVIPDDKGEGRLHSALHSAVRNVIGTGRKDALLLYAINITAALGLYVLHDGVQTEAVDKIFELCFGGSVGLLGLIAAFSTFTLEMTREQGVARVLMRGTKVLAWLFFALAVSALTGLVIGDGTGSGAGAVTRQYDRAYVANLTFVVTLLLTICTLLMTVLAFRQITDSIQADKDVAQRRERIQITRVPIIAFDMNNGWTFGEEKDYGPLERSARGASWLRDRWTRMGVEVEEFQVASACPDRIRARVVASHERPYEIHDLNGLLASAEAGVNVLVVFEAAEAAQVAPLLEPLGIVPTRSGDWRRRDDSTPNASVSLLLDGNAEPVEIPAVHGLAALMLAPEVRVVARMSPAFYFDQPGMDLADAEGVALGALVNRGKGTFIVLGFGNLFTNRHAPSVPESLLEWLEHLLLIRTPAPAPEVVGPVLDDERSRGMIGPLAAEILAEQPTVGAAPQPPSAM
jgi:preprotein translocase subunit SecG